jgi:xanthine/uracil permease
MKYKLLIGVTIGLLLALGLGTVSFANLDQSAIVSNINESALHQTAPDCKYPPCD